MILYSIRRTDQEGNEAPVRGVWDNATEVTELCQKLNELAHKTGSGSEYSVKTQEVPE